MVGRDEFFNRGDTSFYRELPLQHPHAVDRLFALLNCPTNAQRLIDAAADGRPALEGLVEQVETDPDIRAVLQTDGVGDLFKKLIGVVVRHRMGELGWVKDGQRKAELRNAEFIRKSQCYIRDPQEAVMP